jgi:histidinol phosphatase-like PHP family hydrolase
MMNHILSELGDKGIVGHRDNILIYAKNKEQYDQRVEEVLERIAKNEWVMSSETCVGDEKEIEFRGYIITLDAVRMAIKKTEAIKEWHI